MSAADLVAAIREHGLTVSEVALYLSLRDDSRGRTRDLERARRLHAVAARQWPQERRERVKTPAVTSRAARAPLTASAAAVLAGA